MTGVVLAGGRSTRMGTNKALLEFDGVPISERVLAALRPLFRELAIVANDPEPYAYLHLPIWPDRLPGKGPLGGLYTAVSNSAFSQSFCMACDMPFANRAIIQYLTQLAHAVDVVVPRTPDGYQPLHAVYSKTCLGPMESLLTANRLKIDHLFPAVRVRVVEEAELRRLDPLQCAFINVNTRQDLDSASALAREAA